MANTSETTSLKLLSKNTDQDLLLNSQAFHFDRSTSQQFQQQLNFALQRTLDLETQLRIYHFALAQRFDVESLCYYFSVDNIKISIGQPCNHRCQYDLVTDEHFIGRIILTRPKRFLPDELVAIEHSTTSLAYPLRNALQFHRAVQSALTDPLTGAGNRLALDETLKQEMENLRRYGRTFSLALIDLDCFKSINDRYGHDAGDAVLRTVTDKVNENSRATDRFFRYGGEEFVLVMSSTDNEGALIKTERLRALIAGMPCVSGGTEIPVTMSVGVTTASLEDDARSLLNRADQALYRAKTAGRNRVVNAENTTLVNRQR